jgi:PhnB protein
MRLIPYLNFKGNCAEAFRFYERVLGGKIEMLVTHGESPMAEQTPPDLKDKVMHAFLTVGEAQLMGSDAPLEHFAEAKGLWVSVNLEDVAKAKQIFTELAKDGSVTMPFEKTFWAEGFGMVIDRFGTPWMVNAGPIT